MKKTKAFISLSLAFIFLIGFLHNSFYCQNQKNITFLDQWENDSLITNSSQSRYSGCWGFSQNENEYAVIGSTEGTHVFRISENNTLTSCGYVKGKFSDPSVIHREYKTYRNYLYAVCDEGYSSLQIIDLSYLPDSIHLIKDIGAPLFGKTHNIFIDTTEAKMYLCKVTPVLDSAMLSPVPMRVFSLSDPINPTLIWEGPPDIAEVHDIYVKENEAILNCGFDGIRSYNFSNTSNPYLSQSIDFYQDQGYNHQGWLSPNKSDYFFTDENSGMKIKHYKRLPDQTLVYNSMFGYNFENGSTPHNIQCDDKFVYVAYYNEGLRIFDYRATPPQQIAFYDTYLQESNFTMNGAWGVHADYKSDKIIISDRQNGLFLFQFNPDIYIHPNEMPQVYPNPIIEGESIFLSFPHFINGNKKILIYDLSGKLIKEKSDVNNSIFEVRIKKGYYLSVFEYQNYLGETTRYTLPIAVL